MSRRSIKRFLEILRWETDRRTDNSRRENAKIKVGFEKVICYYI